MEPVAEGRINVYACDTCDGEICTVNLSEGFIPAQLDCKSTLKRSTGCQGMMRLQEHVRQDRLPSWGWHSLDGPQFANLQERDANKAEAVRQGGLVLRELNRKELRHYGHKLAPKK